MQTIQKRSGDRFDLGPRIDVVVMNVAGNRVKLGIGGDGACASAADIAGACRVAGRNRCDGYVVYHRELGHRIVLSGRPGETLHVDDFALEIVGIQNAEATLTWRQRRGEALARADVA
jgi:sRNA-binding carbon storage regulator CsrA